MNSIDNPIFVRGLSRSGGTLMVTLLDAHKDVAMSYELYPSLLELESPLDIKALARTLSQSSRRTLTAKLPIKSLQTFFARCHRGGLELTDIAGLLERLADEGLDFTTPKGRMRLVELCGLEKMRRQGKARWGMKCSNAYAEYTDYFPRPMFLNMLRDGRDVLASQLNTGSFNKSPAEVAKSWLTTHKRFSELMQKPGCHGLMVRYEALARDPEPELRRICEFLALPFDDAMLRHTEQDLTVFKASHLSSDRISQSIDTSRIGRWERDLSPAQLAEFMTVVEDGLSQYGYD